MLTFILQLWWIGWGLRNFELWQFTHFLILIFGSINIYFAAEMALPNTEDQPIDMLEYSQGPGRVSAYAMMVYFFIGPYVNIAMLDNPVWPSLLVPLIGVGLVGTYVVKPILFKPVSVVFYAYSTLVLVLTV